LVSVDRQRALQLGDSADRGIDALANCNGSAPRALIAGARERRRALRQDLVAALVPMAVRSASARAIVVSVKIELLINVAVAALCRAVDAIDPELACDYQGTAASTIDRALSRFLESSPKQCAASLVPAMSDGF